MLQTTPNQAGIYIHIPFCRQKCPYCHFYSVTDTRLQGPFVDALIEEIQQMRGSRPSADTLYLGGGTPSVLPVEMIGRILDGVQRQAALAADCEITLEVNPGMVARADLQAYRRLGVNRLNIGVQSFDDALLGFLGRMHTAADARQAFDSARRAGFDNIGIDLIFGIPGQTGDAWRYDLSEAAAFEPVHVSAYQLTYEDGTLLKRNRDAGRIQTPPEALMADLYDMAADLLGGRGYRQYEVSNYARSKMYRSRHNLKYWNFDEYFGFGPAAHSFSPPVRRWNDADLSGYIQALKDGRTPPGGSETLTGEQLQTEAVYLGLRQTDGIDADRFEKMFKLPFADRFGPLIEDLKRRGYMKAASGRYALTRRGMLLADRIAVAFVTWEPGQKQVDGRGYFI